MKDHSEHELNVAEAVRTVARSFATGAIRLVVSDDDDLLQRFTFKQQLYCPNLTHIQPHSGIILMRDVFVFPVFRFNC